MGAVIPISTRCIVVCSGQGPEMIHYFSDISIKYKLTL